MKNTTSTVEALGIGAGIAFGMLCICCSLNRCRNCCVVNNITTNIINYRDPTTDYETFLVENQHGIVMTPNGTRPARFFEARVGKERHYFRRTPTPQDSSSDDKSDSEHGLEFGEGENAMRLASSFVLKFVHPDDDISMQNRNSDESSSDSPTISDIVRNLEPITEVSERQYFRP